MAPEGIGVTIFSDIYRGNRWNGTETRSGPGSSLAPTHRISAAIVALVAELGITSVLDAACGEGFWQPDLPGYLGIDVAPEATEAARRNHPDREYRVADVAGGCPRADLVICRDAMQHLSLADGLALLSAIRASGSPWLLASTYVDGENVAVRTGGFFRPDLEAGPFGMPPALRLYHDGLDYRTGDTLRDRGKMLGLWRLDAAG